jgi:hypothetical protein
MKPAREYAWSAVTDCMILSAEERDDAVYDMTKWFAAAMADARRAALEEAAKACDDFAAVNQEKGAVEFQYCALGLATQIRALVKP